jgi:4-hydroxy-tetrahydrodipicolinate synthase
VAAVKLEDPPTPPKVAALLAARPELRVFGGLGGLHALGELRRGAVGTMTGFAYPEVLRAVRLALEGGDLRGAAGIFDRHLPLIAFEAQPGIGVAIRKELLRRRGVLASARARMGGPLDPLTLRELEEVLDRVGIAPSPDPYDVPPWNG